MGHSIPTNLAVFVDRDGTLNEDHGYVTSPEQLVVFPAVPKALARLNQLGVRVILLTNQSAIGRGFMTVQDLQRIHQKLEDLLRAQDGKLDAVYYCPHLPDEGCACRKPNISMIQEAAEHFSLDLSLCYVVGDKCSDLEAAHRAGVQGVLVLSSDYSVAAVRARDAGQFPIAYVAKSFVQAVDWIEEDLLRRHQSVTGGSALPFRGRGFSHYMDDEHTKFIDISPQRILVIKLSSLGDIVHTLPAVAALRERFPSAHICWLVKSQWASILEGNPDVNEVLSVDVSWLNWPKLVQGLRRRYWDLMVDFQGLFRTGLLGILSGANIRVGFAQAREGAPWMYTDRVSLPGDQESSWRLLEVHAVDRNLAIAQFLGADISHPTFHFPGLVEDHTSIGDVLQHAQFEGHESLIALAPWSRSALKSWPLSRFIQLAEELLRLPTFRVVVLGGPADCQPAAEFRRLESQGLVNLVGKLSLRQLPEVLRRMKLVVGNDSSLIHLAAGVGTPVLAIYGPTQPKATGPYPVSQHAIRRTELACSPCGQRACRNPQYLECLQSISVSSLLESIQEIMASSVK